jgi:hypothetical protein
MLFVTIALTGNIIEGPIGSTRRIYKSVVEGICVSTDQLKTPLVKRYNSVALVRYQGHGINKPFPGYGHLSIVAYVGGFLALQVGGVSDETVKYVREFCGTSTQE